MKETPVIMSTPMVQATLELRKTMTRRTRGLEKVNENPNELEFQQIVEYRGDTIAQFRHVPLNSPLDVVCPFGGVGDLIYVRETFFIREQVWVEDHYEPDGRAIYRADLSNSEAYKGEWKPAIHMFKKDARLWLEITGIRAERLQEITPEDAIAEGAEYMPNAAPREQRLAVPQIVFAGYWDSLNAKRGYGWNFNPWNWPISYKLLEEKRE